MKKKGFVDWAYTTRLGRVVLKLMLHSGVLKLGEAFVRTPLSTPMIPRFIKKNNIDMSDFKGQTYGSYQEFFSRKRADIVPDPNPAHLISPCDGHLSAYKIKEDSRFFIKGSWYKVTDLVDDKEEARTFLGGECLIFRLCADDYHHYCYIDDGFQKENHFIKGTLHSVQPIACETYPVYRVNRRMWTILETKNFGKVAQIAVGAVLVGGIVNNGENIPMHRGKDMGHFELIGSTIVMLFAKDTIQLLPEVREAIQGDREMRVLQGQYIGDRKEEN